MCSTLCLHKLALSSSWLTSQIFLFTKQLRLTTWIHFGPGLRRFCPDGILSGFTGEQRRTFVTRKNTCCLESAVEPVVVLAHYGGVGDADVILGKHDIFRAFSVPVGGYCCKTQISYFPSLILSRNRRVYLCMKWKMNEMRQSLAAIWRRGILFSLNGLYLLPFTILPTPSIRNPWQWAMNQMFNVYFGAPAFLTETFGFVVRLAWCFIYEGQFFSFSLTHSNARTPLRISAQKALLLGIFQSA